MTIEQRSKFVSSENLCFNCLRSGHSAFKCNSTQCQRCQKRHQTTLHREASSNNTSQQSSKNIAKSSSSNSNQNQVTSNNIQSSEDNRQSSTEPASTSTVNTLFAHSVNSNHQVLLATAKIILENHEGDQHEVRALLDSGSEASFISEECVQRCRLRRSTAYVSICGLGTASAGKTRGLVCVKLISKQDSKFTIEVKALILSKLTNTLPNKKVAPADWPHLKNIPLADVTFGYPGKIDMLLGADIYGELVIKGLIPSINDSPVAQNTKLGWILIGPVKTLSN